MKKPIKVLLSEEGTKELLLDGWIQAKTEDGQDVDIHCNRKARNEVMN